ncbi:hypothetical protein PENDEC_c002G04123 [Penicillium decumbens]|uniref:Zn(2)-C6 fungal-type domain-containing protein n=1 Tax=Penicillium decumbens TaxID=69771 RepID=A0A1V6PL63_PENDC|nr:hypothetical protein PENDEC_c002G04123 [Penicillium decumbens]
MVGVPRSSGCSTCVKRRVKCDERVPGCAVLVSSDPNVLQSLDSLIVEFSQPVSTNGKHFVHHWFGFLPSIYGQNQTLDATIKVFVAHHFGKTLQDKQMVGYARSAYGEALYRLRKALTSPSECFSTYVFCAVVLLCIYELFTDKENPESWIKHAKGLGQLIKIRGPDRYRNQIEITLLKASRGLVVMHSMFSGEQCFLASEEWHHMLHQQCTTDMPADLHNCIEQFFAFFIYAPSLVHKFYSLKEADLATTEAQQTISATLTQALDMQSKLAVWYEQFSQIASPPVEVPSSTDEEMHPVILVYEEMIHAAIYCGYYAYMAIIHEVLRTFGCPGTHAAMVDYFCDQICKSVEYSGVGVLGPFRLGFPLLVAHEVSDSLTRSWIVTRLERFSKIYAAAQPKNLEAIA